MRVRKASIAGVGVDPHALAPPTYHRASAPVPTRYEIGFSLGDLRPAFFRQYAEWLADMREYPDAADELEMELRQRRWPSLGTLAEIDPHLFAIVLLALGDELLRDLEWGRDPMVPLRWALISPDEVELRGRNITARGDALALGAPAAA